MPLFCTLSFAKLNLHERESEVKEVIFVTADSCRERLERLTQILVCAFPGSTIYQHTDPFRMLHDVWSHKVDAVLLEAELEKGNSLDLMQKLHRKKPDVPVYIVSETNHFNEKAIAAGAKGYFVLPDGEQQLLDAIRAEKGE